MYYVFAEYLAVFSHLITFHEPQLANHMDDIGFIPDVSNSSWETFWIHHYVAILKAVL